MVPARYDRRKEGDRRRVGRSSPAPHSGFIAQLMIAADAFDIAASNTASAAAAAAQRLYRRDAAHAARSAERRI